MMMVMKLVVKHWLELVLIVLTVVKVKQTCPTAGLMLSYSWSHVAAAVVKYSQLTQQQQQHCCCDQGPGLNPT